MSADSLQGTPQSLQADNISLCKYCMPGVSLGAYWTCCRPICVYYYSRRYVWYPIPGGVAVCLPGARHQHLHMHLILSVFPHNVHTPELHGRHNGTVCDISRHNGVACRLSYVYFRVSSPLYNSVLLPVYRCLMFAVMTSESGYGEFIRGFFS